jgi:hypothetical protein
LIVVEPHFRNVSQVWLEGRKIRVFGADSIGKSGMTLAALLCVCVFHSMMAMPIPAPSVRQAAPPVGTTGQASTDATPTQNQASPSSTQSPPASTNPAPATSAPSTAGTSQTPATQSVQKPAAAHPVQHKKKPAQANCNPPASKPGAAGSTPSDSATNKSGTAQAGSGTSAAASAPSNCPPIKVVVRQGGTTEPSIELAGSEDSSQVSRDRKAANQMLSVTQQNLKKIEGRNLTASQQDTVKQIRQFIEDSRKATTAGDLDRARTLAWKAQLLSEDLVNPKK